LRRPRVIVYREGPVAMRLRPNPALTFDDVLLVPRHSRVASRADVSTRTALVPGISLAIPFLSANMDTVTESAMADIGGLRSGMSYAGAETIARLWERAEFVQVTSSGVRESGPHDVRPLE
jgi:IMP dehydrogenase/GMP reductase